MALNKAMVTGTRGTMDWFSRNATSPYYSVWCGKQLLFSWNDEDLDQGEAKLENDLSAIEENGVGDLLTIRLHPNKDKAGFITDKSPIYASLNFRPSQIERNMYGMQPMGSVNNKLESMLEKMLENQNILMSKMAADELEEEEEEEPQNALGNILNSPHVQSLLIAGVTKLFGMGQTEPNIAGIAGIPEDHEVIEIVNSLMNKGVTIDHLRKLNEMNSMKLQSLLIML